MGMLYEHDEDLPIRPTEEQEPSDRSPEEIKQWTRRDEILQRGAEIHDEAARTLTQGEPFEERDIWCSCEGLILTREKPGPHHEEDCVYYQLPDYGVFGPDE